MYFDGIRASSRFVTFRLYNFFFIEDASLRQAMIEFLKNIRESLLVNLII